MASFLKRRFKESKTAFLQKREADLRIRTKARAEALRTKETEAIKFAREKEQFKAKQKLQRLKSGKNAFSGISEGFGKSFGVLERATRPVGKKRIKMKTKKKGSKKTRTTTVRRTQQQPQQREPFNFDFKL